MRFRFLAFPLALAICMAAGWALGKTPASRWLNPPDRKDGIPFTHAVVAGDTIYLAGTLGLEPETGQAPKDPAKEVRLALDGVKRKLKLAGAEMEDLVSVTVFCSDISLYGTFNEIYGTYFEKGKYPTRAFVGSGPLLRGARFEVVGIAVPRKGG